jgi:hypothetical protein
VVSPGPLKSGDRVGGSTIVSRLRAIAFGLATGGPGRKGRAGGVGFALFSARFLVVLVATSRTAQTGRQAWMPSQRTPLNLAPQSLDMAAECQPPRGVVLAWHSYLSTQASTV